MTKNNLIKPKKGGIWTPQQIDGLKTWISTSEIRRAHIRDVNGTDVVEDGQAVIRVPDKTNVSRKEKAPAIQTTDADQPTLNNGTQSIAFDRASGHQMKFGTEWSHMFLHEGPAVVCITASVADVTQTNRLELINTGDPSSQSDVFGLVLFWENRDAVGNPKSIRTLIYQNDINRFDIDGGTIDTNDTIFTAVLIWSATDDAGGSSEEAATLFVDGSQVMEDTTIDTLETGNPSSGIPTLGEKSGDGGDNWDGDIYEVVLANKFIPIADREDFAKQYDSWAKRHLE